VDWSCIDDFWSALLLAYHSCISKMVAREEVAHMAISRDSYRNSYNHYFYALVSSDLIPYFYIKIKMT
jgi:hypothetical protein